MFVGYLFVGSHHLNSVVDAAAQMVTAVVVVVKEFVIVAAVVVVGTEVVVAKGAGVVAGVLAHSSTFYHHCLSFDVSLSGPYVQTQNHRCHTRMVFHQCACEHATSVRTSVRMTCGRGHT